jgi:hypothetical protein
MAAEALYLTQEVALGEIDAVLAAAGIPYAVIKGAASRIDLYDNPAIRACYDLDILVRPDDRVAAATALTAVGFKASPEPPNISRELVLSRHGVDIDLHWGLLREGRLRMEPVEQMLERRKRVDDFWALNNEDAMFVLLVHPAFAKHLAAYCMGLHRVVDIVRFLQQGRFEWQTVSDNLRAAGVRSAAWATLRWVDLLLPAESLPELQKLLADLAPGALRRAWIDRWLRSNLAQRMSGMRRLRLLVFSSFLHDAPADALRALAGRRRAHKRVEEDLQAFAELRLK